MDPQQWTPNDGPQHVTPNNEPRTMDPNYRCSRIWIVNMRLFQPPTTVPDPTKGRYTAVNHTRDIFFISLSYAWTTEE